MGGIQCQENKKDLKSERKNQLQFTFNIKTTIIKPQQPNCYTITWQDTKPPQKIGNAYSPFDSEETEDVCYIYDSDIDQSLIKAQSISQSDDSSTTIKNILKNLNLRSTNRSSLESNTISSKHFRSRRNKKISMDELEALF